MRGSGACSDLERESGGAEKWELNGPENGLNLLPLSGYQVLPGHGSWGCGVFLEEVLGNNHGWDSTLSSVPRRNSVPHALPGSTIILAFEKKNKFRKQ